MMLMSKQNSNTDFGELRVAFTDNSEVELFSVVLGARNNKNYMIRTYDSILADVPEPNRDYVFG